MGKLARIIRRPPVSVSEDYYLNGYKLTDVPKVMRSEVHFDFLEYNTTLHLLELKATQAKTQEALASTHRMEKEAAVEFKGLVTELVEIQEESPNERIRSLMETYIEHSIHRTANAFDKTLRIAQANQAAIVDKPVLRAF